MYLGRSWISREGAQNTAVNSLWVIEKEFGMVGMEDKDKHALPGSLMEQQRRRLGGILELTVTTFLHLPQVLPGLSRQSMVNGHSLPRDP